MREVCDLRIANTVRLCELLNQRYVLVAVLGQCNYSWIDKEEIEKLLAQGEGRLAGRSTKDLNARRALKHRRVLVFQALERMATYAVPHIGAHRPTMVSLAHARTLGVHDRLLVGTFASPRSSAAASTNLPFDDRVRIGRDLQVDARKFQICARYDTRDARLAVSS